MSDIPGNTLLSQMSIPGTHDTMTYSSFAQAVPETQTQDMNLSQQLNAGIRFIDVRTAGESIPGQGTLLALYHGYVPLGMSLNGDVFQTCINFLQQHPTETIVVSISADPEAPLGDTSVVPSLVQQYAQNNSQYFYFDSSNQIPSLDAVRGKILVLRRYDATGINNPVGMGVSGWPSNTTGTVSLGNGGKASIEDAYSFADSNFSDDINSKATAAYNQIKQEVTNPDPNTWYITFTSAASNDAGQYAEGLIYPNPYTPNTYALGNLAYTDPINLRLGPEGLGPLYQIRENSHLSDVVGTVVMDFPDVVPYHAINPIDPNTWYPEYGQSMALIDNIIAFNNFSTGNPPQNVPQTIAFNSLPNKTYGDADFALTAAASSGLPVSFAAYNLTTTTVNGISTPTLTPANNLSVYQDNNGNWFAHITGTGSALIVASQDGNFFFSAAPTVSRGFTINQAAPNLTVSDGGPYAAEPMPAAGTALGVDGKTPVSGTWSFTYYRGTSNTSGSLLDGPPVDPGTYTVIGRFTSSNPNYSNGTAQTTFTITAAVPALTVGDPGGGYNGKPFSAKGSALGLDGPAQIPGAWTYTYYSGSGASGTPLAGPPTDAGTYTVVGSFTSGDNKYSNGTAQTTFTITPAAPALTVQDTGGGYNGNPFPATGAALGVDGTTPVSGTWSYRYFRLSSPAIIPWAGPPTDAGQYSVTGIFTSSDPNYSGGTVGATFTLTPATPTASVVDAGGAYNGKPFPATGIALGLDGTTPVSGTWSYAYYAGASATGASSTNAPTNPGTYTVVATFTSSDHNYSGVTVAATFAIKPAFVPTPPSPPTLHVPPLLAFFDSLLGAIETLDSDGTVTETGRLFGLPFLVSHFDSTGNLESVTLFGMNVTALFEML